MTPEARKSQMISDSIQAVVTALIQREIPAPLTLAAPDLRIPLWDLDRPAEPAAVDRRALGRRLAAR